MLRFLELKEELKQDEEKCLDSGLWHACAGGMVQMPAVNSKVFYFLQGHAEHASGAVDFTKCRRPHLPPYILCRVHSVKYMADTDSDEVYAKLRLLPLNGMDAYYDDDDDDDGGGTAVGSEPQESLDPFPKILTQSDANNGGGFSVPRFCAERIFPPLNLKAEIPLQYIEAKDVHGETWKFKHIFRGSPKRHLLTTGWSPFVNKKRLVAGDSIVFLRNRNKEIYVAVRRDKRRTNGNVNGKVKAEAVIEAVNLAAEGQPFEVVYYPRVGTPEFCVKASSVKTSLQIPWCPGMRFKMAFETEDSRISWFMGTISSVQFVDPQAWNNSPWRVLQVTWDEPDLVQDVKRVCPWLVQLLNMPVIPPHFSAPNRMRLPQHPDVPQLDPRIYSPSPPPPMFVSNLVGSMNNVNPFGFYVPETTTPPAAGMQGARHAYGGITLPDLDLNNMNLPMCFTNLPPLAPQASTQNMLSYDNNNSAMQDHDMSVSGKNVSPHLISNGDSAKHDDQDDDDEEENKPYIVLFGKKIRPREQKNGSQD